MTAKMTAKIKLNVENPYREGTLGRKNFSLYRDGMTVAEHVEAFERAGLERESARSAGKFLSFDRQKGWVTLVDEVPDAKKMQAAIEGAETVSDKIRALDRAGFERADIARFLGKSYQHVRNVLVADQETGRLQAEDLGQQAPFFSEPQPQQPRSMKVRVGPAGQITIPAPLRETLGVKDGDVLFARVEDGELHLLTTTAAMRRAQAIVRQFVPEGVSLVDELIADRRREAEREAKGG